MSKNLSTQPAPYTASGGYAAAQPVSAVVQGHKLPTIPQRRVAWYLAAHPKSWELVKVGDDWMLLPVLKPIVAKPGTHWVEAGKRQGDPPDTARMRARFEDQGFIVLTKLSEYLTSIPEAQGPAYFLKWERVKTYPDGDWEVDFDRQGYDAWRAELVADGRVPPPRAGAVAAIRRRLEARMARAVKRLHEPAMKRVYESAQGQLAALEKALAANAERASK